MSFCTVFWSVQSVFPKIAHFFEVCNFYWWVCNEKCGLGALVVRCIIHHSLFQTKSLASAGLFVCFLSPVGLNQTTSRFENETPAAPSDREKAFSKRHKDARRPVSLSVFARASCANHRCRPWVTFLDVVLLPQKPLLSFGQRRFLVSGLQNARFSVIMGKETDKSGSSEKLTGG